MARYKDVFSDNYINRFMKQWGLEDNLARAIKHSLKNEMVAYGRKLEGVINELNMLHARCVVRNEPIPKEELGFLLYLPFRFDTHMDCQTEEKYENEF